MLRAPLAMAGALLIYGATGYTAGLIISRARDLGLRPILAARNGDQLELTARRWDLEYRLARLDEPKSLAVALDGVSVVLNAAGPFSDTAAPVMTACLQANAHYLDISGELDTLLTLEGSHRAAAARGVMLMPGVGFDVVPSDCLCAHAARALPDLECLRIAVSGLELVSRGSLKTLASELAAKPKQRRAGQLCELEPGALNRSFDFGDGQRACTAVTWGDLVTAYYTCGAPEIETYFEATAAVTLLTSVKRLFGAAYRLPAVRALLAAQAQLWPLGPTPEQRARARAAIVVEAVNGRGRRVISRLQTPEAYTLTAHTAASIARRVLDGDLEPGFQTPARLFGPDFILGFQGVLRTDLEPHVEH